MEYQVGKYQGWSRCTVLRLIKGLGLVAMLGTVICAQGAWALEAPANEVRTSNWNPLTSWQLEAQSGYAFAGSMNGWGLGAGVQWYPLRYLGLSALLDSADIQVEGKDPKFVHENDGAYAFGMRSTFLGVGLIGRLPIQRLTLFAQVDLGHVWTTTMVTQNVACSFFGGTTIHSVAGLQVLLHRQIVLGLDFRIRSHSVGEMCENGLDGAHLPFDPLKQVSLSFGYRFFD